MVQAFLTNRTMSVKVNGVLSPPLHVPGGSPQGSILSNYLFCLSTECFGDLATVPGAPCLEEPLNATHSSVSSFESSPASDAADLLPETDLLPGTDSDEDEIRAADFIYFRTLRRIEDSVLSDRMSQSGIDDFFGLPPRWTDQEFVVQVYIDDTNCIEEIKQLNSVSVITADKHSLKIHCPEIEA